jgi:hypothetical protein
MSKHTSFPLFSLRSWGIFAAILFLGCSLSMAQTSGWDGEPDEDDTEEVETTLVNGEEEAWDVPAGKHKEVEIRLNGEDFPLKDDLEIARKETLDIKVRYLRPGSEVILKMQKGGINLDRKVFYCNEKGQLDLEVQTGNKKIAGNAIIFYTPSDGPRKERKVHIAVR